MGKRNYKKPGDGRSARGQRLNTSSRCDAKPLPHQQAAESTFSESETVLQFSELEALIAHFMMKVTGFFLIHRCQYSTLFSEIHTETKYCLPTYLTGAGVYIFVEKASDIILYIGKSIDSVYRRIYKELGGGKNGLATAGSFRWNIWSELKNTSLVACRIIENAAFDIHVIPLTVGLHAEQLEAKMLGYHKQRTGRLPPLNSDLPKEKPSNC